MKNPMAEVPAASGRSADEEDVPTGPGAPPASLSPRPASQDGRGTGDSAGVLGPEHAKIGNWPDPM